MGFWGQTALTGSQGITWGAWRHPAETVPRWGKNLSGFRSWGNNFFHKINQSHKGFDFVCVLYWNDLCLEGFPFWSIECLLKEKNFGLSYRASQLCNIYWTCVIHRSSARTPGLILQYLQTFYCIDRLTFSWYTYFKVLSRKWFFKVCLSGIWLERGGREREEERGIDFSGLRISRKYIDINTGHIIKSLQSLTIFSWWVLKYPFVTGTAPDVQSSVDVWTWPRRRF